MPGVSGGDVMRTANARHYRKHMLGQCWADIEDGGTTLNQYSTNFGIARQVSIWECVMSGDLVEASG